MRQLLAAFAVLMLCLSPTQAANYNYYGALALSQSNGAAGTSSKRVSYENARDWALSYCGEYADDCMIAVYFVNTCAAVARGTNGGYGTGKSNSLNTAKTTAIASCRRYDTGCVVRASSCSRP
ncbi:DUF4189 domain-containing protein [Devosia psychrophila]|jgi:serine/threonine-protein kinase|uniref:DUF4189 domain-containing protein n=1 Tax=Devosia psychrophila TaxID=728005 RepID=A0A0F5PZJ1_9HYPH|nr:DUF4189 domain-containing protein [Devosia psychrophila]KKC34053.1 hypothetical protein WH91_05160 [Devosia psychrophila]SFC91799.1 protein of unknown function [Devosia psychrophila]